jgi:MFS family permease
VLGAGAAAAAIAAAAIGKISGRLGYARTLIACVAGGAAFMVLQGFARTPYVLLAFRVGAGICLGGTIPSMNALVAAVGDKSRQGATYGLMSSVSSVGMALGPVLGASVASGLGYPAVFFATGLVLAGVAATAGPSALRASRPRDRG